MIPAIADMRKALILCVEDEIDLRDDLVEELEAAGYAVVVASDGGDALKYLSAIRPDLVLCDISMPGIDGYEVLRIVRETRPDLSDVPFVFLTAQAGSEQMVRGKRAGADDYLVKPVDFDLMLATIQARLGQVSRIQSRLAIEIERIGSGFSVRHQEKAKRTLKNITQTLDYVASGIVLLDRQGKVQFANHVARQLVGDTVGAKLLSQIMGVTEAHGTFALNQAVEAAIAAHFAGQEYADSLAIPRPKGLRNLLVTLCALAGEGASQPDDPAVVVFISDSESRRPAPVDVLVSLFDLTATEAQIAWAFAEGKRTDEIAEFFGISSTTVAFHKRNLFQKTHTNRQADLIALMLTLPLPASQA
jgi:DNA-binding NarL/FixJ family response regulator